jgi:hypothetical protein
LSTREIPFSHFVRKRKPIARKTQLISFALNLDSGRQQETEQLLQAKKEMKHTLCELVIDRLMKSG